MAHERIINKHCFEQATFTLKSSDSALPHLLEIFAERLKKVLHTVTLDIRRSDLVVLFLHLCFAAKKDLDH